ncbi:MAG: TIGR04282 family arsenosugar biosynthesis glycosyltransferase [Alphaproteobacteria bacterium]|nr:TIGR04282 family arsenosugar biosynthesis glycosyltransferase [Alphaproteobacteria bacterium]
MARPLVIVFARAPRYGTVKTRLARDIGAADTLRFYRNALAALIRRIGHDARWETCLCVTPDTSVNEAGLWPVKVTVQGHGDLGRRMVRALRSAGTRPTVVVGSDIPELGARQIAAAFHALRQEPFVLGPANDGGYWLIGARDGTALAPGVLDGVRWSSAYTLADSASRLRNVHILDSRLDDVDDGAGYRAFMRAKVELNNRA